MSQLLNLGLMFSTSTRRPLRLRRSSVLLADVPAGQNGRAAAATGAGSLAQAIISHGHSYLLLRNMEGVVAHLISPRLVCKLAMGRTEYSNTSVWKKSRLLTPQWRAGAQTGRTLSSQRYSGQTSPDHQRRRVCLLVEAVRHLRCGDSPSPDEHGHEPKPGVRTRQARAFQEKSERLSPRDCGFGCGLGRFPTPIQCPAKQCQQSRYASRCAGQTYHTG